MNESLAAKVLQLGLDLGADFSELFVEETRASSVSLRDKKVESATAGIEYGVGIRLLFGTQVLYAHTSLDDEKSLLQLVRELVFGFQRNAVSTLTEASSLSAVLEKHPVLEAAGDAGQAAKLKYLQLADRVAREYSHKIAQVSVNAVDVSNFVEIFNSEGLALSDQRNRARFSIHTTAAHESDRFSAHEAPGSLGGFEFFRTLDIEDTARMAAERATKMLEAPYLDGGQLPVVMGSGFGGVIFHEACGHPLETEAVRHKASPFAGKIGESIAHEKVTAIDDGTLPGVWGSLNVDDEGMPTEKTTLIEKGVLKAYLSDRVGAEEVGVARTGSARRESYKYAPVSRMRNTYIAAGSDPVNDMIASVDLGLFARKMGGGSVNPATGEFNFSVEEGYAIRGGKIVEAVRGATLIGKGHEILPRISMVGPDLEMAVGMCGAASGSVPVTVGQPTLKVDRILVGGR